MCVDDCIDSETIEIDLPRKVYCSLCTDIWPVTVPICLVTFTVQVYRYGQLRFIWQEGASTRTV